MKWVAQASFPSEKESYVLFFQPSKPSSQTRRENSPMIYIPCESAEQALATMKAFNGTTE